MNDAMYFLLFQPGEFFAPRSVVTHPDVILRCDENEILSGDNAIFHREDDILANTIVTQKLDHGIVPVYYQFQYFTPHHRQLKKTSEMHFDVIFKSLGIERKFNELMPAVAIKVDAVKQVAKLYHFNDTAWHGTLLVNYADVDIKDSISASSWELCNYALEKAYPRLLKYRHLLNDTCWYTRWKHDMELERKFTFKGIPDTWSLNAALYDSINLRGELHGFVPELDMALQVFDYDNHIFEVMDEPSKGYISFIPQANKKVAIKQKWFTHNAELRKENIVHDLTLGYDEFEEKAREMAGGEVKRLAAFRRKRFDVNFESLRTGNIYGVYFDICRSLERPAEYAFSQCEVEYCRSRTMHDYRDVLEEYEQVCAFVEKFLKEQQVPYERNLYSKLDFARETYNSIKKSKEVTHG